MADVTSNQIAGKSRGHKKNKSDGNRKKSKEKGKATMEKGEQIQDEHAPDSKEKSKRER